MTNIKIDLSALDDLDKALREVAKATVINDGLRHLEGKMKRLEPKAQGAFSRLATAGQRRAFWSRVRRGLARVGSNGYIRTNDTARAWTTRVVRSGKKIVGILGNKKRAARWLYDEKDQQPFHAVAGQPRTDIVAKKEEKNIAKIIERSADKELRKYGF